MPWDPRNLCQTVPPGLRTRIERRRCPVARPMKYPPWGMPGETTSYHDWTDRSGRCRFCGQTLAQITVRTPIEPEPGSGAHLARALRSAM